MCQWAIYCCRWCYWLLSSSVPFWNTVRGQTIFTYFLCYGIECLVCLYKAPKTTSSLSLITFVSVDWKFTFAPENHGFPLSKIERWAQTCKIFDLTWISPFQEQSKKGSNRKVAMSRPRRKNGYWQIKLEYGMYRIRRRPLKITRNLVAVNLFHPSSFYFLKDSKMGLFFI